MGQVVHLKKRGGGTETVKGKGDTVKRLFIILTLEITCFLPHLHNYSP